MITATPVRPKDSPTWKPFLRQYFWVRRHSPSHGWCICWHSWNAHLGWGITWGIGFQNLQEAKAVRRFLNRKVARGMNYGLPFGQVVAFIESGNGPESRDWGKWTY